MGKVRPPLDLTRDLGFILKDAPDAAALKADLDRVQKIVIDLDKPKTFDNIESFKNALELSPWEKFIDSPRLLERAELYFASVADVYDVEGDVYYELVPGYLGSSVALFIDYPVSGADLYKNILDAPIEGDVFLPENAIRYEEDGTVLGSDVRLEAFGSFSHEEKARLLVIARRESLTHEAFMGIVARLGDFTPAQVLDALEFGYLDFLAGLPDPDAVKIIRAAQENENLKTVVRGKFEKYVSDTGEWHERYLAHSKFVREYIRSRGYVHITEAMVMSMVVIESGGNRKAENGVFKGLMQVSPEVFSKYRDPNLPNDPFDYRANLAAGVNYLEEWCFTHFNEARSPAIGIGNYNWGCGNMGRYLDYEGTDRELADETFNYLANFLILKKMLG